jgi:hypothetical protein
MSGRLEQSEGLRSLRKLDTPSPGTESSGGFAYDEATMQALINKWLELAEDYHGSLSRIVVGELNGPGSDFASAAQARAATTSTEAYREYLSKNFEYCVVQAQKLQNTLDDYRGVEHHNVTTIFKSGPTAGI